MYITTHLGIPQGHSALNFVDVTTNHDSRIFLDPCLIELSNDPMSRYATGVIADFADQMYKDMRSGRWNTTHVFDEAHEINETKLGYGNGRNGKGKTAQGMKESLNGLCDLANQIPTISKIQDISVLVEDFAEDCMSDLLTNILRRILCQFTAEQMEYYKKEPSGIHEVKSWDCNSHRWKTTIEPYWLVDGQKIMLVPKWWVRKNFLFKAHQYLYLVIIERIRTEADYEGWSKRDIGQNMERDSEHWEYDKVIEHTLKEPEALSAYHTCMCQRYECANGSMNDDDLDMVTYGQCMTETA